MADGTGINTLGVLVKYTMSKETADLVMERFSEMSTNGESVSYLDCVIFDSALEVLGLEKEYYGLDDDEWESTLKDRAENEKKYTCIKTIDITDTWKEVMS